MIQKKPGGGLMKKIWNVGWIYFLVTEYLMWVSLNVLSLKLYSLIRLLSYSGQMEQRLQLNAKRLIYIYDKEKGLAMAISKKSMGNKGNYYEVFKKWIPELESNKEVEKND